MYNNYISKKRVDHSSKYISQSSTVIYTERRENKLNIIKSNIQVTLM